MGCQRLAAGLLSCIETALVELPSPSTGDSKIHGLGQTGQGRLDRLQKPIEILSPNVLYYCTGTSTLPCGDKQMFQCCSQSFAVIRLKRTSQTSPLNWTQNHPCRLVSRWVIVVISNDLTQSRPAHGKPLNLVSGNWTLVRS